MAKIDHTYHNLLEKIFKEGYDYKDESRDVMCKQISSYEFRHNIRKDGFPAITTKKLYWKGVVGELIWFLRGDTNIKYLIDNNIHIWDKDAYNFTKKHYQDLDVWSQKFDFIENGVKKKTTGNGFKFGELGRVYGAQWRKFGKYSYDIENGYDKQIDQISDLIQNLMQNPMSRRHIVTAWNPAELDQMALPPCHWAFEILPRPLSLEERRNITPTFYNNRNEVGLDALNIPKYTFDLKFHMRSVDTFLGLPFNIASYALLMEIISQMTNMIPNELIGDLSNVHIYHPHIDAVKTQLKNDINKYNTSNLDISNVVNIDITKYWNNLDMFTKRLEIKDFKLENYESYPAITAEMLAPK